MGYSHISSVDTVWLEAREAEKVTHLQSTFHFIMPAGQLLLLAFDLTVVRYKQGGKHSRVMKKSAFFTEDVLREAPCVQNFHSSLSIALCCLANPQKAWEWTTDSCKSVFKLAKVQ